MDNRPGAGGSVGGLLVTQAPPDGYTLMLSNSTPISIGPFALERQPYDPVEGFTHIALIGSAPCVVMANPKAGIKSMADLEANAKKAGRLDFGSGGPASIGHIYGELMKNTLHLNMVHVPYRGGAPMTTDLIAGVVPVGITTYGVRALFQGGGLVRASLGPFAGSDVPSVVEAGYAFGPGHFFGLRVREDSADGGNRLTRLQRESCAGRYPRNGRAGHPVTRQRPRRYRVRQTAGRAAPRRQGAGCCFSLR